MSDDYIRRVDQPDGLYDAKTGVRLGPLDDAPTYENQLKHARRLLAVAGRDALWSPHAATGRMCGCKSCFCCAALQVYNEEQQRWRSGK